MASDYWKYETGANRAEPITAQEARRPGRGLRAAITMSPIDLPCTPFARASALRSLQREERLLPSRIRTARERAASFEANLPALTGKAVRLQAALAALKAEAHALEQRLEDVRSAIAEDL